MRTLAPQTDKVAVGAITATLGEPDDPIHPTAWEGPLRAGQCTFDIGLIEQPLAVTPTGQLFVATYSGSERNIALFDLKTCKVLWDSGAFAGKLELTSAQLTLGDETVKLDGSCVPVRKSHPER